jgi:hypothetical protein
LHLSLLFLSFSLSLSLLPLSESGVYDHRSACYKGTARFAVAPAVERSNEVKLWEQKGFFLLFIYLFIYLFIFQFLEVGGLAIFPKKS